jgi:hypothetical protein
MLWQCLEPKVNTLLILQIAHELCTNMFWQCLKPNVTICFLPGTSCMVNVMFTVWWWAWQWCWWCETHNTCNWFSKFHINFAQICSGNVGNPKSQYASWHKLYGLLCGDELDNGADDARPSRTARQINVGVLNLVLQQLVHFHTQLF